MILKINQKNINMNELESLSHLHPAVACTVVICVAAVTCVFIWGFFSYLKKFFN